METQTTQKTKQYILNVGVMQYMFTMPEEGLLVRLQVEGNRLSATFEEGVEQRSMPLQVITNALERLQVDQIVDRRKPFDAYDPSRVR